jgi:uracil-DNA glycosylase
MDPRTQSLQKLNQQIASCTLCPLNQKPYNPGLSVPGFGSLDPKLMIIGEGPGYWESQKGRPFVGPAGTILQELIMKAKIPLGDLFITNVVKHRPPDNRNPKLYERNLCHDRYLYKQIEIVQPKVIICIGKIAAYTLAAAMVTTLPSSGLRGKTFYYELLPVYITWHSAYVMRNPNKKPELLEDLTLAYNKAIELDLVETAF